MPRARAHRASIIFDPNSNAAYDARTMKPVDLGSVMLTEFDVVSGEEESNARGRGSLMDSVNIISRGESREQIRSSFQKFLASEEKCERTTERRKSIVDLGSTLTVLLIVLIVIGLGFAGQKSPSRLNTADDADDGDVPAATAAMTALGVSVENKETIAKAMDKIRRPMSPPPSPTHDLELLCDSSRLERPNGYALCQAACDSAGCCMDEPDSCEEYDVCDLYAPCTALRAYHVPGQDRSPAQEAAQLGDTVFSVSVAAAVISPIPTSSEVDEACERQRLVDSAEAYEKCKSLCDTRACCFSEVRNCRQERTDGWCQEYVACMSLFDDF